MTRYELTYFKKMLWVWKTKSLLFCLRYDPLIVFRRQNHITFIFMKTMSLDLLVQMAYSSLRTQTYFRSSVLSIRKVTSANTISVTQTFCFVVDQSELRTKVKLEWLLATSRFGLSGFWQDFSYNLWIGMFQTTSKIFCDLEGRFLCWQIIWSYGYVFSIGFAN